MSFFLLRPQSSTVTYHALTTAWAAACSTPPSTTRKGIIDTMVVGMEADGNLATLDWLLILAGETAQAGLVNIANAAKVATNVNSTTFTADRGYTGDGISMHISLGETLGAGGNFAIDNAARGVWCTQAGASGAKYQMGTAGFRAELIARSNSGNETFNINDGTSGTVFQGNTGSRSGHRAISRVVSTNKLGYFNGGKVADAAVASTTIANNTAYILRQDTSYGTDQVNAYWHGAGLDDAGHLAMHNRISTALTAIGAI